MQMIQLILKGPSRSAPLGPANENLWHGDALSAFRHVFGNLHFRVISATLRTWRFFLHDPPDVIATFEVRKRAQLYAHDESVKGIGGNVVRVLDHVAPSMQPLFGKIDEASVESLPKADHGVGRIARLRRQ